VNAAEVHVPDAGLRKCLNVHLDQPADAALTETQLASIEELDCGSTKRASTYHIEDLTGVEHLTGATTISLMKNNFADLSPLSDLEQLESLDLRLTEVADLAPLAGLASLEWLHLGFNDITEISALSNLTNLTELTLSGNLIEDLAPLAKAESLRRLNLGGARAVAKGQNAPSLTGLEQLTQVEFLSLSVDRELEDISAVAALSNLRTLDISDTGVSDVTPLAGLVNLDVLTATRAAIADASALQALAHRGDVQLSLAGQDRFETIEAGDAVAVPTVLDAFGAPVELTTCETYSKASECMEYISVTGNGMTFIPEVSGDYTLGFEGTGRDGFSFSLRVDAKGAPASDGSASDTPTSDGSAPDTPAFTDNPLGSRFHDPVQWMAHEGISVGYGDGTFKKDKSVSRGETAQFLYRMTGQSVTAPEPPFTDVRTSFKNAVAWLAQAKISVGYANGQFRPNRPVTRGEFAAFLYRMEKPEYFQAPGRSPFTDLNVGGTHWKAISWLSSTGITAGYTDGTFKPGKTISRAEVAAFLYRYDSLGK
jgi:Leucine-rich repeat (LRR) protein